MSAVIVKRVAAEGSPDRSWFAREDTALPTEAPEGGVLVDIRYVSADPYMRSRFKEVSAGYTTPLGVGAVVEGFASGIVTKSNNDKFPVGCLVGTNTKYQKTVALGPKEFVWPLPKELGEDLALRYGVGALGMPGATAYMFLTQVLQPKEGQVLYVNAASGAVGAIAGQFAKQQFGCKVIGCVGGDAKVAHTKDVLGFDYVFDYRALKTKADYTTALKKGLEAIGADGIDMYFENVGGASFDATLPLMKQDGRVVICGLISGYNEVEFPPQQVPLEIVLVKNIKIEGALVFKFWMQPDISAAWAKDTVALLQKKKLIIDDTIFDDFGDAMASLFTGDKKGKAVVKL